MTSRYAGRAPQMFTFFFFPFGVLEFFMSVFSFLSFLIVITAGIVKRRDKFVTHCDLLRYNKALRRPAFFFPCHWFERWYFQKKRKKNINQIKIMLFMMVSGGINSLSNRHCGNNIGLGRVEFWMMTSYRRLSSESNYYEIMGNCQQHHAAILNGAKKWNDTNDDMFT